MPADPEVIREEWQSIQRRESELTSQLRASSESQALQRLYGVATRLRDALLVVQREAFGAFSDRAAFEEIKRRAAKQVDDIAHSFLEDARAVKVEQQLESVRGATNGALLDLPFPRELSLGREAGRQRAVDIGMQALGTFLGGGDPVRHVQDVAAEEAGGRLSSLSQRYSEWWDKHWPRLQEAPIGMQDALFGTLVRLSLVRSKGTGLSSVSIHLTGFAGR